VVVVAVTHTCRVNVYDVGVDAPAAAD